MCIADEILRGVLGNVQNIWVGRYRKRCISVAASARAIICNCLEHDTLLSGIYMFFVAFGLGMLALQLIIGASNLWLAGRVPKILLIAKAHSMAPSTIVKKG